MIAWVRHGESTWNAAGRQQGRTAHPPLTARGRVQAERVAGRLRALGLEAVLTSPAVRARQTADIVAAILGVSVDVEPRLHEQADDESQRALHERAVNLADALRGRHVAVIGHGETIRAAVTLQLGRPPGLPANAAILNIAESRPRGDLMTELIAAPDPTARAEAAERLAGLATPTGALGRLGDLAVWLSAVQGRVPPEPPANVRCVVFAGDHGVAAHGVSAYPSEITGAMVHTFVAGKAGVSALAAANGVHVRVLDISVAGDLDGVPDEVTAHKIRRGSGAIHVEDALTREETTDALARGESIAAEEIARGADLLIGGDMGIGNTTPAAALVAAGLGLPAVEVTGRGTGVDDDALRLKQSVIQQALDRAGDRTRDPVQTLTALGSADLAVTTGYLIGAARAGVPVLLDGLISVACALTAERIAPGAVAWFAAGHRSTEPAQGLALDKLGLVPLLDLGMRLGEGSGAVAAVPLVREAATVLRDVALLRDLLG